VYDLILIKKCKRNAVKAVSNDDVKDEFSMAIKGIKPLM